MQFEKQNPRVCTASFRCMKKVFVFIKIRNEHFFPKDLQQNPVNDKTADMSIKKKPFFDYKTIVVGCVLA